MKRETERELYMSRRRELKMKDVGLEHLEQYNQLLRYVFQVTDKELQEIGWEEKEIIRAKSPTLEQADVNWSGDLSGVCQSRINA